MLRRRSNTRDIESDRCGRLVAALMRRALDRRAPSVSISSGDLRSVLEILVRSGAGPLGWWALRDSPLKDDPSANQLRDLYRAQALRAAVATSDLQKLSAASQRAGVEPLIGKGWAMARHYPAQGLRPYGDFDLYVPADEFQALVVMATEVQPTLAVAVDLHRGASYLDDRDFSAIRARSVLVPVETNRVRVFAPEDQLRLACLHMLAEGAIRPPWLCDVAVTLNRLPEPFDWDYFASGDPRRTEWCFAALGLAHVVLDADVSRVPEHPLLRVQPTWLGDAVLRVWGQAPPSKGNRFPITQSRRAPRALAKAMLLRWPNPIEATIGVRGRITTAPRLPYQLADAARRATKVFT